MAHRKEQHDRIQTVKPTWHGLEELHKTLEIGKNELCLEQWEVVPVELFEGMEIDGKMTYERSGLSRLVCSDNRAIKVGQGYNPLTFKPITNSDFLKLVEDSIGGTSHKIASAGSVRNRGRVFLSIELNGMEKFKAAGREFSAFLNFGNGHDKSSVLWVNTSNVCTVCDNTYSMNLFKVEQKNDTGNSDDISLKLRHTKNAALRFPEIAKLIDKAIGVQAEFQIEMDNLAKQTISAKNAENMFAGFIGRNIPEGELKDGLSTRSRNIVSRLMELHNNGLGNRGENLADSFQAVTEYYTRESSRGKTNNVQKQFVSSEFGAGLTAKQDFWRMVTNEEKREQTIKRGENLLTVVSN